MSGLELRARCLALAGLMGSGKTTVGRLVARWIGAGFEDLDEIITAREGASIPDLFARGEKVFRQAEAHAARAWAEQAAADPGRRVLALGGGTLEDPEIAALLGEAASVIHLDAQPGELLTRLGPEEIAARPLLAGEKEPERRPRELRQGRQEGYARAHATVATGGMEPEEVAVSVLRELYDPESGPWRQPPRSLGEGVFAGRGVLRLGEVPRAVVLWDAHLPASHSRALAALERRVAGGDLLRISLEGGEASKQPETLVRLWQELLERGVDKDVPLWVAGGGTLTDLGGLAAQTYKRGLSLSLFPTTLLAQLDAALGGKNGINLAGTKNAVGTIRLPSTVQIDSLYLLSLPAAHLRGGLSEAVKSALVGDRDLFALLEERGGEALERDLSLLEEIVRRSAAVKLRVVGEDLRETGRRRELNLGHTLGHALESLGAQLGQEISHGEAVAVGMVFACRLAERLELLEQKDLPGRLEQVLSDLGLPTSLPDWARGRDEDLLAAVGRDKKRRSGENTWVLPVICGRLECRVVAPEDAANCLKGW